MHELGLQGHLCKIKLGVDWVATAHGCRHIVKGLMDKCRLLMVARWANVHNSQISTMCCMEMCVLHGDWLIQLPVGSGWKASHIFYALLFE